MLARRHAIVTVMDLARQIDIYCERTDPSLWSEPVNALTNLAFFAAAWFGWREAARVARAGGMAWDLYLLAVLAAVVGLGSFAFHTTAQVWSAWADGLAILGFIYVWLARYLARVAALGVLGVTAGLVVYFLLDRLAGRLFPPDVLNGSGRFPATASWLLAAAGIFTVSLAFRTVDLAVCERLPLGTHFLWHLLNGAVLAAAIGALARARIGGAHPAKP